MVKDLHLEQEEEDFENARDQEVKKLLNPERSLQKKLIKCGKMNLMPQMIKGNSPIR